MKQNLKIFDKSYINTFAKEIGENITNAQVSAVINAFSSAITDLCKNRSVITNYSFEYVNEFVTHSQTQNSNLDMFLIIESAQIELNTLNLSRNRLKAFWNKVCSAWSSSVKASKKKKKKSEPVRVLEFEESKYNVVAFKKDLQNYIAKNISEDSMIYIANDRFILKGKDEFGLTANIYPIFRNGKKFKLFNDNSSKFIEIDFEQREKNLEEKYKQVGDSFFTALRIFNNLYYHLMGINANQIFMESLIYSCPNNLFVKNCYDMFLNLVNYLNATPLNQFVSITNINKGMFAEKLNTISAITCKNFFNKLNKTI